MTENKVCGLESKDLVCDEYEVAKIRKTTNVCPMCEDYARAQAPKPIAIMSCEGACLRGEVSRQAANIICHKLAPEKTVRICLGGAFTKDTGQRSLVGERKEVNSNRRLLYKMFFSHDAGCNRRAQSRDNTCRPTL